MAVGYLIGGKAIKLLNDSAPYESHIPLKNDSKRAVSAYK